LGHVGADRREFLPTVFQFAPACRKDILNPLGLAAVREGNDETIGLSEYIYRSSVSLPRFAADVGENAKTGKPACEWPGDSVCERNIDLRKRSLPEAPS